MKYFLVCLKKWAIDYNFCHAEDSQGNAKVAVGLLGKLTNLWISFWRLLFWPLSEKGCWCCASVRGILYGWVLGCLFFKWWWLPFLIIGFYCVLSVPFIIYRMLVEVFKA